MSETAPSLWWLVVKGESTGPNSEAFIQASLQTGVATRDQLACPVGGDQWQPLRDWPQFRVAPLSTPISGDLAIPNTGFTSHDVLMLSLTGWFYLGVSPALLVLSWLFWLMPTTYAPNTPQYQAEISLGCFSEFTSVVTTLFGMVGGYRLLEHRRESVYWISGVCISDFAIICMKTLAEVLLAALADPSSLNTGIEPSFGYMCLLLAIVILALAILIFQIYSLIWLWQIREKLKPL